MGFAATCLGRVGHPFGPPRPELSHFIHVLQAYKRHGHYDNTPSRAHTHSVRTKINIAIFVPRHETRDTHFTAVERVFEERAVKP